ncbi:IclR family transcriptional regulator [Trinickia sp. EG282A]|uniref:IclR family transcriptional regulator n=1 Tax=Trinickia sp. EG282A TaxID=3237013 RepID=UPI0034D194D9
MRSAFKAQVTSPPTKHRHRMRPRPIPETSAEGAATLDRAFAILFAFRLSGQKGLSFEELAARTGLYKSTVLRLTASLMQLRMIYRDDDGRYHIGPTALQLGALYQRGLQLCDAILPSMHALRDDSGESLSFHVMREKLIVCLCRLNSSRTVCDHIQEGDVQTMTENAAGYVLAAFSHAPGKRYEQIRYDCCCVLPGQHEMDTASIAVPVFSAMQSLAGALALTGTASRIDVTRLGRMKRPMIEAAIAASKRLGSDAAPLRAALRSIERKQN